MSLKIEQLPISRRLRMNTRLVPPCETVADIGCDHAYSSIYLAGTGRVKRCIAMDVAKGPLLRAKENIAAYGLTERIETRLSNGLEKLEAGEAQVLLFSGMGGPLILQLLKERPDVTKAVKALVLQPQSELARVRKELGYIGFEIKKEDMCCEDGKYYTVMYAEPAGQQASKYAEPAEPPVSEYAGLTGHPVSEYAENSLQELYGAYLTENRHPVLIEYLKRELEKKTELKEKLERQDTQRAVNRSARLKQEIRRLSEYLERG